MTAGKREPKSAWREEARRRYGLRRFRYMAAASAVLAVWLGFSTAAFALWLVIFRHGPPPKTALAAFEAVGTALTAIFARYGPTFPMRGRPPEEIAAERFLAGRDVRSDDGDLDLGR